MGKILKESDIIRLDDPQKGLKNKIDKTESTTK